MENNSEQLNRWVEDRMESLDPGGDWRPDADRGLDRLHERPRRGVGRLRRLLLAGAATSVMGAAVFSFPPSRALAERCWQCVAALAPSARIAVPLTVEGARIPAPGFTLTDATGAQV